MSAKKVITLTDAAIGVIGSAGCFLIGFYIIATGQLPGNRDGDIIYFNDELRYFGVIPLVIGLVGWAYVLKRLIRQSVQK